MSLSSVRRPAWASCLLLLTAIISGLAMIGPSTPQAVAAEPRQHWGLTSVAVRDETGYPEYRRAITLAAERWNAAGATVRLVVTDGRGAGCGNPQPGEIPVCRHPFSGVQVGEARAWTNGGHVVRASVLIDTRPRPFEHLVAIACHELGHALGRGGHRTEQSSCMTATIHSSFPDEQDLADLRADHAHAHAEPAPAPSEAPSVVSHEPDDACDGTLLACLGTLLPSSHP